MDFSFRGRWRVLRQKNEVLLNKRRGEMYGLRESFNYMTPNYNLLRKWSQTDKQKVPAFIQLACGGASPFLMFPLDLSAT